MELARDLKRALTSLLFAEFFKLPGVGNLYHSTSTRQFLKKANELINSIRGHLNPDDLRNL